MQAKFHSIIAVTRASYSSYLAILMIGVLLTSSAFGQRRVVVGGQGPKVDSATKAMIIDSVASALNEVYVFPKTAGEMENLIRKRLADGAYDNISELTEFTQALTEDLRGISHDRHLGVHYAPEDTERMLPPDSLSQSERLRRMRIMRHGNFGFAKMEVLPGNIGYLDLRQFADTRWAGATAIAAMNFLANCDAIIIDLRKNGGGNPSMIQLISSYFFDEPVHLNSFYIRKEDSIQQFWTQEYVQGPKMTDVDLYILTSHYTFSAAEEFTYNMKSLKRATIVGETTGGGAHPTEQRRFSNLGVAMSLPYGRAINPVTGTNWEGTGVTPDVEVDQGEALNVAVITALESLAGKETIPQFQQQLRWELESRQATRNPTTLTDEEMQAYVGSFGPRKISLVDGVLYYQREDMPRHKMIPVGNDRFILTDVDDFRLEFIRDDSGKVIAVIGHYLGGASDRHEKDK